MAIKTPVRRSQNRDRRDSEQANTAPMRAPIGMASSENTITTTFMTQRYHPGTHHPKGAGNDSPDEDFEPLWTDRCLRFEQEACVRDQVVEVTDARIAYRLGAIGTTGSGIWSSRLISCVQSPGWRIVPSWLPSPRL
jgi:hypothetical protein